MEDLDIFSPNIFSQTLPQDTLILKEFSGDLTILGTIFFKTRLCSFFLLSKRPSKPVLFYVYVFSGIPPVSCFCYVSVLPWVKSLGNPSAVEVKKCQEKAQLALASTPAVTRMQFGLEEGWSTHDSEPAGERNASVFFHRKSQSFQFPTSNQESIVTWCIGN